MRKCAIFWQVFHNNMLYSMGWLLYRVLVTCLASAQFHMLFIRQITCGKCWKVVKFITFRTDIVIDSLGSDSNTKPEWKFLYRGRRAQRNEERVRESERECDEWNVFVYHTHSMWFSPYWMSGLWRFYANSRTVFEFLVVLQ